ncbi:MAG: tetratricopeptide repeat protein [Methanoregula sp.]|nr:MAG: tetratricopeptide repeat protein [Methanoregula sp.]
MLTVLVIDDEPDILNLVRHFLERPGDMKVETITSTKEGLDLVTKKEYDAIVLDYYLPEINGIDFLKILRAKGNLTPIIIFTGVGRENAAIEALNNGADFFLKKGDDPRTQFRELDHMIRQAKERRSVGRSLGTSQRIISDVMSFSKEAMFAIDCEGRVISWNHAMEELSGVTADMMVGRGDHEYSVPFFGKKALLLIDLIFESDDGLAAHDYAVINREEGAVVAWTRAARPDGREPVFWMRAKPLYDGKGGFIGAVSSVRDITDIAGTSMKGVPAATQVSTSAAGPDSRDKESVTGGFLDRITGKAKSSYKQGVQLYYREGKYEEALKCFDRAVGIDENLPQIWNDRGLCLKEMGRFEDAQKSFERALELAPRDEEYVYDYGEILETIGILRREKKIFEKAILAFSKVTDINPNNASAWNHLGVCIKEIGHDEEARQAFARAQGIIRMNKDRMFQRKRETV